MFITVHSKMDLSEAAILKTDTILRVLTLDGCYSRIYLDSGDSENPVVVFDCWESVDEVADLISDAE